MLTNRRRPARPGSARTSERALLKLHAALDAADLWRATQDVLRATLPVEFLCLCLKPFERVPGSIVRDCFQPKADANFAEYLRLNPAERYLGAHPGVKVARLSDVTPTDDLRRTVFYREHMRRLGYRYFAALAFWRGPEQEGLIGLHRTAAQGDFTEPEMQILAWLHPEFRTAVRRVLQSSRERSARRSLEHLLDGLPLAAAVLDWSGRVLYENRAVREAALAWEYGPEEARQRRPARRLRLPQVILEQCRAIREQWRLPLLPNFELTTARVPVVHHPRWPSVRASIRVLQSGPQPGHRPTFLVQFNGTFPGGEAGDGPVGTIELATLSCLTARERELAKLTAEGLGNKELADRLGKSVFTVKKQLQSVFRKLEVPGRARLIALLR